MKVRGTFSSGSAILGRLLLAIPLSMAILMAVHTAPAHALTRAEVIDRAQIWVKKRVPYSQSGSYHGYRRDCSGMVSMAWKLKTSYTSDTIRSAGRRISKSQLQPGDAIRYPGHVAIFAGWKNKRKGTYYALEQPGWGGHAHKKVKKWKRGSMALRRRGIEDNPIAVAAATPTAPAVASATTPATTAAVTAAAAVETTPAP